MKKLMTFAMAAGAALALTACGPKEEAAPAEEPAATETAPADDAMSAEDAAALDGATTSAEGTDPNNNPVGPAAAEEPAAPAAE